MFQALCCGSSCSSIYHQPWRALCLTHSLKTRLPGASSTPAHKRFLCSSMNQPSSTLHEPPTSPPPVKSVEPRKHKNPRPPTSDIEEIRRLRWKKAEDLRASGCEPYAYSWNRSHTALQLQNIYKELSNGEEACEDQDFVSVAGRVMARRAFGKLTFLTLRDESSSIQLYCEKNVLPVEKYEQLKGFLDVGDIVGASGTIKRTEKGELSVKVKVLSILTKSLLPLPDKWHGLTDIEKRYRQRYLDMIMRTEVASVFRTRAQIISRIRRLVEERGFIEVETPVLQGAAGGAEARPFVTHHNALHRNLYLRIATELHLKRMVVGGFEKVYELGRIFRNEGISTRHNPEFTSIEIYQAYADYTDMMTIAEELITKCALDCRGSEDINYQGTNISFKRPWRRASMLELVQEATGIDFSSMNGSLNDAKAVALTAVAAHDDEYHKFSNGIHKCTSMGHLLNEVFEARVERTLIQPTFVVNYPIEVSPLAKPHRSLEGYTERFELYIYGREIANAFSELTDPVDQRRRLELQVKSHNEYAASAAAAKASSPADSTDIEEEEDDENAYEVKLDEDFLTALEYGMPPAAGMGIGIDRLVMLLTDSASIRDVIAFPVLKSA